MARPVAVDLFGGVGGMSLGFEQAGFDVVCALESDRAHAAAHRFNFPLCEVLECDARIVTPNMLQKAVSDGLRRHARPPDLRVDVVFGGPPCQGFSVGGLGDPADPRNRLVDEFARLTLALQPRAWVLENVPAMAGSGGTPDGELGALERLFERMSAGEYEVVAEAVLNAKGHGVPQDRRRLLVVGTQRGLEVKLPDPTTAGRPRVPGRQPRPGEVGHAKTSSQLRPVSTVRDAIGDLPDLDEFAALLSNDEMLIPSLRRAESIALMSPYARRLAGMTPDPHDYAWPRRRKPSRLTASLRTIHTAPVVERFRSVAPGEREPISRFLRLHPDGVAPTLRAGTAPDRGSYSAPRPIHYRHDRVISVREAARLHGFPDWFRPTAAKWHGFRQVGNSVPPPLARAVGAELISALGEEPCKPDRPIALGDRSLLHVSAGGGRTVAKRHWTKRPESLSWREA